MGNDSTKLTCCSFCGSDQLITPQAHKTSSTNGNRHLFCVRCHVSSKQICPLSHIFIAPFEDTLHNVFIDNEEKDVNEEFLINSYLIPFFKLEKDLLPIRAGKRFIIDCIEFKVLGCYPPRGFVSDKTQFHLNDENEQLLQLKFQPLQQIHLLPSEVSLETYLAQNPSQSLSNSDSKDEFRKTVSKIYENFLHKISNSNSAENENKNEETSDLENYSNSHLYVTHIKPYLLKNDDQKLFSIRKKKCCKPSNSNSDGILKRKQQQSIEDVSEKAFKRHLTVNETFSYNGVQFRVQTCVPYSGGFITSQTNILLHGQPLKDIREISIRPIFEDLPSHHKHLLPPEIKTFYLDPYFKKQGWCYISHARELVIKNVRFSIRKCVPLAHDGIITCVTKFNFNAAPIKVKQLQHMQEEEDMSIALHLMNEEKEREEYMMNRQRVQNNSRQLMLAAEYELRSSDPFSQILNDIFQRLLERRYRAVQLQRERNRGIHPSLVNRLPTFAFKRPASMNEAKDRIVSRYEYKENGEKGSEGDESESDSETLEEELQRMMNDSNINVSCRICLEYYINGEELRILPCFHKYHKECVDKWFRMSRKCPICKTPVVRPVSS